MTTLAPTTLALTSLAPTSLPPTTVGPTSLAPTTLSPTSLAPTTAIPIEGEHDNDITFNCYGNNYAGVLIIEITIDGNSLSASYGLADLELSIPITITGSVPSSEVYSLADLELIIETSITGWGVANAEKKNWVGWSKIGEANFELDRVNDAGYRPMSWPGYVYQVRKLDKNVMIYGSGGVTVAFPVSSPAPTFGFKDILGIGIKNKTAVTGDEFTHFFIDIQGCLYKYSSASRKEYAGPEGLIKLGFEEFLLPLTNPSLLWDADEHRLYISDETVGYIYNEGTLTGGYANLTGLYRVNTVLTAVSPDELIADPVELCTDIIDFKRRGLKSIESMQFDAISEVPLQAAIDYRYRKTEDFKTTQWTPLNDEGVAHRRAAGVEFRVRLKGLYHGTFDLSYISIQFKFIDQRFTRDPKGPIDVY